MSNAGVEKVEWVNLGLMDYQSCLEEQRRLHHRVVAGEPGKVIFVQHPATLTLGKNSSAEYFLRTRHQYRELGIAVVETERGGEVTAHEPGQLVVYPILPLGRYQLTPKRYVQILEQAVIATLAHYGVKAATDPEYPGVWVGKNKICAVGVRIKQRVSLHGIALNIENDLSTFCLITPCGIKNRSVCRLQDLVSACPDIQSVIPRFGDEFAKRLGLKYCGSP